MSPVALFDDDNDDEEESNNNQNNDDENKVKINKRYAREYESRKLRQELQESKRKNDVAFSSSEESGSDDEVEDEAAVLLTTKLDTSILKTIHALRTKDERIYDPNVTFFGPEVEDGNDEEREETTTTATRKPKYITDVIREQILEDMERGEAADNFEANNEDNDESEATLLSSRRLAYDAKQQQIRMEFLQAVDDNDSNTKNDEPEEAVLRLKQPRNQLTPDDEAEFIREVEKLEQTRDTTSSATYVDPKGEVQDGESFLLNFFKQRPWKEGDEDSSSDNDTDEQLVPMKTGEAKQTTAVADDSDDESSLEHLDTADTFEAEYNFRFEQAVQNDSNSGADLSLQTYARSNNTSSAAALASLRRPDDRRKIKRAERMERKAKLRKAKEEQLQRLKNAKRLEMEEKLAQLHRVIGTTSDSARTSSNMVDDAVIMKLLEGDFDPEQFETLMKETYNDDFYNQEDPEWKHDKDVKKSLDAELGEENHEIGLYDDDEDDNHEGTENETAEDALYEEGGDDDDDEFWPDEEPPETTELERKVRAKMQEELYKLDYEDIVAGIPTRFKYRQVEPNNYGLTTEEILMARDSTLKQYVSLKKMAPYAATEYRVHGGKRRKFRELLKQDIEEQMQELQDAQPKQVVQKKKRRLRKKEKNRNAAVNSNNDNDDVVHNDDDAENSGGEETPSPAMASTEIIVQGEPTTHSLNKRKKNIMQNEDSTDKMVHSVESTKDSENMDKSKPQREPDTHAPNNRKTKIKKGQDSTGKIVHPVVLTTKDSENMDKSKPIGKSSTTKDDSNQKKKKKRKRKHKVEGVTATRMEAYGL